MKTYSHFLAISALLLLGAALILTTPASAAVDPLTKAANSIISAGKNAPAAVAPAIGSSYKNANQIAAKVAAAFSTNQDLMDQAPAIALAFTKALLAQGDTPEIRYEIGQSVANLIFSIKGDQTRVVAVLQQVATAIKSVDVAVSVAGYVSTALKVSEGDAVKSFLPTISETLTSNLSSADQQRVSDVVTNVGNGQLYNELPPSPTTLNTNNQGTTTENSSSGGLVPQESQNTNL